MVRPDDKTQASGDRAAAEHVSIDRKADVPVGVQLGWALRAQIRDGRLAPGQQLPTLREMAQASGLNVNTVRAVYRRLEQKGLIESQQGSGTFVAAAPRTETALGSIAAQAAREARETGLDPREVAAALYVATEAGEQTTPAAGLEPAERSEPQRRHVLRGQIATLERTLAELEAEHPGVAPAPARTRRGIGPALLTVEELAQVRTALIRRLIVVQAAIDERFAEQHPEEAAHEPRAVEATTQSAPKRRPRARPSTRPAPASG
ncbi:MAG TPA: GntR family transcriptional regulator [Solirubrobacteraceae bacterium]|jgi:GntR family transcriptional regulator